ncbi:MAG: hypothetical protein ACTSXX_02430 [Candidatus Baldrarchaeia archaeon]
MFQIAESVYSKLTVRQLSGVLNKMPLINISELERKWGLEREIFFKEYAIKRLLNGTGVYLTSDEEFLTTPEEVNPHVIVSTMHKVKLLVLNVSSSPVCPFCQSPLELKRRSSRLINVSCQSCGYDGIIVDTRAILDTYKKSGVISQAKGFIFELLTAIILAELGYSIKMRKRLQHYEVDILALKGDTCLVIECKSGWSKYSRDKKKSTLRKLAQCAQILMKTSNFSSVWPMIVLRDERDIRDCEKVLRELLGKSSSKRGVLEKYKEIKICAVEDLLMRIKSKDVNLFNDLKSFMNHVMNQL